MMLFLLQQGHAYVRPGENTCKRIGHRVTSCAHLTDFATLRFLLSRLQTDLYFTRNQPIRCVEI